jgi:hypothetical protein
MNQPNFNLLQALEQAKRDGYVDDYFLNEDGEFSTRTAESPLSKIIKIIPCLTSKATLYLITGGGNAGTWIHHWDI